MFRSIKTTRICRRLVLCFLLFAFAIGASFADSFSLGLSVPYIGQGSYQGESVMLLNLAPIALEYSVAPPLGIRFSPMVIYSLPVPATIEEFWLILEFPFYLFTAPGLPSRGFSIGPVALTQIHDQDFGGNYWGIGLASGLSWTFGSFRFRTGLWVGYHQLYDMSLSIPESSKSGIAIGLTLLEAGLWLF